MNQAILGVLIGGTLAGIGSWISTYMQHKKWKIESRVRLLENKRTRLENLSQNILDSFQNGLIHEDYNSDMMSSIEIYFPRIVSETLDKFISKENMTDIDKKQAYYTLALAMKSTINKIDMEIESLLS